jgi:hypothetical protein
MTSEPNAKPITNATQPNTRAKWGLYAGLSSFLCGVTGPLAIFLGWSAKKEIAASPGRYSNGGSATAAIVLGVLGPLFMIFGALAPGGTSKAEEPRPEATMAHAQEDDSIAKAKATSSPSDAPAPSPAPTSAKGISKPRDLDAPIDPKAVAEGLRILDETETLILQGKAMDPLRRTDDLTKLKKCGELMRARQPQAQALSDRAMKLPLPVRAHLAAPGSALMCVSCSESAGNYCRIAEQSLTTGRKSLKER